MLFASKFSNSAIIIIPSGRVSVSVCGAAFDLLLHLANTGRSISHSPQSDTHTDRSVRVFGLIDLHRVRVSEFNFTIGSLYRAPPTYRI